jgi:hypothetical protein
MFRDGGIRSTLTRERRTDEHNYAAVRPDQDREPVRRFECFTADLHHLADWLQACGVKTVAMQSTGVYWIPLYEILEERGLEVYLVNARHTKNLPGRKSDVQESQWLLKLHTYGYSLLDRYPKAHFVGPRDSLCERLPFRRLQARDTLRRLALQRENIRVG